MRPAAPRPRINPLLRRYVAKSGIAKHTLASNAGYPYYVSLYEALRAERVSATPLAITRLKRVAEMVGFPTDEIFLDEVQA